MPVENTVYEIIAAYRQATLYTLKLAIIMEVLYKLEM